jgi:hypothetical protein
MTPNTQSVESDVPPNEVVPPGESLTASAPGSASLILVPCHELIAELSLQFELLRQQLVARDELLVVLLQERLELDGNNSSKPPSSDRQAQRHGGLGSICRL